MTHQMNNAEVAKSLELLADLLEIDGESAFRGEGYGCCHQPQYKLHC